jgi:hypothetical protein
MRRTWAIRALVLLAVIGLTGTAASADNGPNQFAARASGFNEVPAILSDGAASLTITVHGNGTLTYRETISGTFSSTVTQSHIHFGERGVSGGIFLFLCTNLGNGPAGVPACPQSGTVTRTVSAADFSGIATQNVPAGNFDDAVRILRSGDGYVNVHTTNFPAGEIRGQVHFGDD